MSVRVTISTGTLPPAKAPSATGAGAVVVFEGIVRAREGERDIDALHYETYEPMAQNMLEAIATELIARHGLLGMHVEHSRGRVAVGECSFRLAVMSRHRKEALAAMDEFIDRMKRDVPIWKSAPAEGSAAVRPA
jgi:molybdopterin synthase catalytic subunit